MVQCNHVAFRVHDIERSIRFYEELLPGRVVRRKEGKDFHRTRIAYIQPEGQPGFAIVLIQPTRVRFILAIAHRLVPRQFRSSEHMGFECPSREYVDERFRLATERGARIMNAPTYVDDNVGYICEVLDPDGNAVEWTFGKRVD